ncbi:hypothetical protein LNAOJCKE_5050 [Methylorubrum aminovorans]|uniref:Uncharacterized protein n=2 Tax=Methylorubrum TaxID=2282523 RepID=A0ABQ4UKY4_9HYPH|nr:hypothetical protein LNAOJCKE_5050 [Methylorubrum aminovorans]GJE78552.1 hypothetical protein BGCPKDLD_5169 [Methylorubrum suomiense]
MNGLKKTRAALEELLWLALQGLMIYIAIKVALYV